MTKHNSKQQGNEKQSQTRAKQVKARVAAKRRRIVSAMYQPLCKILILIGVATILLAVVTVWQYRSSTRRTATTTGTITEVDKVSGIGRDMDGGSAQKCRIGYTVEIDGKSYTDVLGYRGDPTVDKCNLVVGQLIEINYDPSHPSNNAYRVDDQLSDHDTLGETVASAASIGAVGLVPLIIGMIGLYLSKRHHDDQLEIITDRKQSGSADTADSNDRVIKIKEKRDK